MLGSRGDTIDIRMKLVRQTVCGIDDAMVETADEQNGGLRETQGGIDPPRFSLRRMFLVVTAFAVFILLFLRSGPIIVGLALFVAAAIGLHVLGNALGVRLRDSARLADDAAASSAAKDRRTRS